MEDCWKVLGIEPSADKKAIKRAYTTLIKTYSPETHAEKFQQVRAAYDEALRQLKRTAIESPTLETAIDENVSDESKNVSDDWTPAIPNEEDVTFTETPSSTSALSTQNPAEQFMLQLHALWQSEENALQQQAWEGLMRDDALEDLLAREELWVQVFAFIAFDAGPQLHMQHPTLLRFLVCRFNTIFHWSQDELRLQRYFNEETITQVLSLIDRERFALLQAEEDEPFDAPPIQGKWVIFFIALIVVLALIFEKYLVEKNPLTQVQVPEKEELLVGPVKQVYEALEKAEQAFQNEQWQEAIAEYNKVLAVDPDSHSSRYNRGLAWFRQQDYEKADEDFHFVLQSDARKQLKGKTLQMLAVTALRREIETEAINFLQQSLAMDKSLPGTHGMLAQLLMDRGNYAEAKNLIDEEISINPVGHWYNVRAWLHGELGQTSLQCADLEHACNSRVDQACEQLSTTC